MAKKTFACVGDGGALPSNLAGRLVVLTAVVACASNNVDAEDIVKLFDIPAGTLVQDVVAIVETAEGETLTFDVGDFLSATDAAVDADGYLDGVNGNSAAASKASTEALTLTEGEPNVAAFSPAYARGKYYTADSWIGATFNNAADTAKITFKAICVNCD